MPAQTSGCVGVERVGGVTILSLDDGKANAIGFDLLDEVAAAMEEAAGRGDALVLAGREGWFSAGLDIGVLFSGPEGAVALFAGGMDQLLQMLAYPRPLVAACTGHAVAGGAVLLLACDVRVGLDGPFKIGLAEVSGGVPLPAFATLLARERLDPRHLVMATLGAQTYDPAGAASIGFLDRVVPTDVVATATGEAEKLAAYPAEAYRLAKEAARRELLERLRAARQHDLELVAALLGGGSAGQAHPPDAT